MSIVMPRNAMTQPRRGMRGGAWFSSGAGGLEDVEDGEEEDPDDIYKVPIETDIIERGGASRPIVSGEKLAEKTPRESRRTPMKTCAP